MDITGLTNAKLIEYAKENDIPLNGAKNKKDILKVIKMHTDNKEIPTSESSDVTKVATPQQTQNAGDGAQVSHDVIQPPSSTEETLTPAENVTETSTIKRVLRVIRPPMHGADVKAVQEALIAKNLHCGNEGANGKYNASTALAVKLFQAQSNLPARGRVERSTATALGLTWTGR